MKKVLVLFAAILFAVSTYAQKGSDILLTVGNTPVTVDEFRYIYEKNNGDEATYSRESVMEYLELYKKFKLKVEKAKEMQLDTIPSLKTELKGYRDQLASSYIFDKEVTEQLVKDVYNRKKQDVRIRHIMINKPRRRGRIEDNSLLRAEVALRELKKGKRFEEAVKSFSEDKNSKPRGGDLGYLTAPLPDAFYNLELAMYSLPLNKFSDIIESDKAYHIIEVLDRRPARGTMNVAHMLFKYDDKDKESMAKAKKDADAAYQDLKKGGEWSALVKKYSVDAKTAAKGGRLPTMHISMYAKEFEDAAFALKKDGDISKPVKTRIGYHIIKRLDKPELGTLASFVEANKEAYKKRDRFKYGQENYLASVRKEAKYKRNDNIVKAFAETLDADSFYGFSWTPDASMNDATIASMGGNKIGLLEFVEFCRTAYRKRGAMGKGHPIEKGVNSLFEEFIKEKTVDHTIASVEKRHPDFKSLMREYQEGILLFEITKQHVWDRANQDTVGLEAYHLRHKNNYRWGKRARVVTYTVAKDYVKKIKRYMKRAKKYDMARMLKKYNRRKKTILTAKEDILDESGLTAAGLRWEKNFMPTAPVNDKEGNTVFRIVKEVMEPTPKTLQEARGFVVADYQNQLDKEWVEELNTMYPIQINNEVLSQLIK